MQANHGTLSSAHTVHGGTRTGSARLSLGLLVAITALPFVASAAPIQAPSGYLTIEMDRPSSSDIDLEATAKLKLQTKRMFGTKGVVELKASAYEKDVSPRDIYIDYRFDSRWKLTMGYTKKIVGMEFQRNRQYRLTIHRSPLYQKMENLGLVGRQLNARVHLRPKNKKTGMFFQGALGGSSSRDVNGQLYLCRREKNWGFAGWLLAEAHRAEGVAMPVVAESIAVWRDSDRIRLALELFHGIDAERTQYTRLLGSPRTVQFAGAKLEIAPRFALSKNVDLVPVMSGSFWMNDVETPRENSFQVLGGLKLQVHDLVIAFNADLYGERDANVSATRSYKRRGYYAEIAWYF